MQPGALQHDEWAEGRRCLGLDLLVRCRTATDPTNNTDTDTDTEEANASSRSVRESMSRESST